MRVRLNRQAGRARETRRPHPLGSPAAAAPSLEPDPAATPAPEPAGDHLAERRHREAVMPEDHALYRCQCGFAFEAAVSTTVACPHCGSGQAW